MFSELMSGLSAATNFGTGFDQGQDQAQQRQMQMQQIMQQGQAQQQAYQINALKLANEQQNMGYQKQESAYARQLATDPDTMDLPPDQQMNLQMKAAFAAGDIVRGNEMAVNLTNLRQSQIKQGQEQVAATTARIEQQQKLHTLMGGTLAVAADQGPEAFEAEKQRLLDDHLGTDADQQNLHNLAWNRDLGKSLRLAGMTANQETTQQIAQLRADLAATRERHLEGHRVTREELAAQKEDRMREQADIKAKVGAPVRPPTPEELLQAAPFIKETGLDPKSADFNMAQQDLVGIKKQIQRGNKNISDPQAYARAAALLKSQEIKEEITPNKYLPGEGTKKVTYKMIGATPDKAIDYNGHPDSLIPGRFYRHTDKRTNTTVVSQFTGTDFAPQQ
jgi:hypothetical protein